MDQVKKKEVKNQAPMFRGMDRNGNRIFATSKALTTSDERQRVQKAMQDALRAAKEDSCTKDEAWQASVYNLTGKHVESGFFPAGTS